MIFFLFSLFTQSKYAFRRDIDPSSSNRMTEFNHMSVSHAENQEQVLRFQSLHKPAHLPPVNQEEGNEKG